MAEKYYDCLQCAEQCCHVTSVVTGNNNNNANSTNNNVKLTQKIAKTNHVAQKSGMNSYRVANRVSPSTIKYNTKILQKNPENSDLSKSLNSQPLLLTPAKKSSSLARPVRVYDSFSQPKELLPTNYAFQTYEDDEQEETSWPIRLRLEQMFELSLPQTKKKKKKKSIRLMKQQQQNRHVCKDTERLLRVFSVNNVDQNNRYNVSRCIVM